MIPRKVALVVGQLQLGGAEGQLFELATRLDRARYDPFVVCLSEVQEPYGSRLRERSIRVEVLPRAGRYDLGRVRALGRLLHEGGASLAHSYLLAANAYTYLASRLAGRLPFIASSRTCIPPSGPGSLWLHRRAFSAASAVIANSHKVMEFTRDLYRLPAAKIRVIPNGVDAAAYAGAAVAARVEARREIGAPEGAVVIGTVGRLSPEKNLGLFLDMASRIVSDAGPAAAARFVVVGDGPSRAGLQAAAGGRLGLAGRVIFTGASQDVSRALAAFDVFVLTSSTEGLPNAVMEAMAAGLPVVATRVGGTAEVVEDGVSGHLVPPADAAALAARVLGLARDPESARRMGERGRERVASRFGVERMVAATAGLYDEVLG